MDPNLTSPKSRRSPVLTSKLSSCRQDRDYFKANLHTVDLKNDALVILQLRHSCAADESKPRARRTLGAGDVCRAAHIVGDPLNLTAAEPDHADSDAANGNRIDLATEV